MINVYTTFEKGRVKEEEVDVKSAWPIERRAINVLQGNKQKVAKTIEL
jgi:hypothetical protein